MEATKWRIAGNRSRQHWDDIIDQHGEPIAQVLNIHGTDVERKRSQVLAAAPALAEALRGILPHLQSDLNAHIGWKKEIEACEAALASAGL
jgi:hypothetical protein